MKTKRKKQTKLAPAIKRELKDQARLAKSRSTRELSPSTSSVSGRTSNGNDEAGQNGQTEETETGTTTAVIGLHDYTEYEPLVDTDLEYKVIRRQELGRLIEEAEAEKKRITDDILAAMTAAGLGEGGHKVLCHEHVVSTVKTHTPSTLSKTLLMEAGVKPSVIEQCTVPGLQYVQVRVNKAK